MGVLRYDYNDVLEKEKKVSDALKKPCSSIEEVHLRAELFRTKVPSYKYRFETGLREGIAAFLTQPRDAIKELAKSRDLGIKKSVGVNFSVLDEMLQALETELSYLGPSVKAVD